jgi:predicted ATP-grasp superfamily ATP-dependent carboligase
MAFAADGRSAVVLGFAYGLAGDPAFAAGGHRYCGSIYPFPAGEALRARLDALAQLATRALGLVGVNGIDFVARDGEAFVLELNPRYCASMELIERSGGPSVFGTHAAACQGSLLAPGPALPPQAWGKAVLWARVPVIAPDTRSWLARGDLADIPFPGERIAQGRPICTLFASGADRDECYRRLVESAASLEAELGVVVPACYDTPRQGPG